MTGLGPEGGIVTKGEPGCRVHHHDAEYSTVHHDAEYTTVHHDAVTHTETTYTCSGCGATK